MTAPATTPSTGGDVSPETWRGVATEEQDDLAPGIRGFLRSRSRRLLGSLLRPRKRALIWGGTVIVLETLAKLAGPILIGIGIDEGIPPIARGESPTTLGLVVGAFLFVIALRAVLEYSFLTVSGKLGQDVLYDLRERLYDHFQQLSLSFHERYTSGRVISRLTSDVEAIWELLGSGILAVTSGGLSILGISIVLLVLDWPLALVAIGIFPFVILLTRWFRARAEIVYRETREAVALVIVHFVESLGGIRAVQAFRREPRNQAIFEDVDDRLLDANLRSNRLAAVYGPGVNGLGRVTIAVVLLVGSYRVAGGSMSLGTLAAFMLYVRRFFEPVQDLSQFYNLFQSAAAALEKLSGVLEEPPAVPEPEAPVSLLEPHGEVVFDDVRFGYRKVEVLHGVDLVIPAGQTVALGGGDRRRQVDGGATHRAVLRPHVGFDQARRHRPSLLGRRDAAAGRDHGDPGELPLLRVGRRQHLVWPTLGVARRGRGARRASSAPTSSSRRCPTDTTPTCASAAAGCRRGSASSSPSPARSSPTLRCSSSTRRRRRSTSPRSAWSSGPCGRCWPIGRR